MVPQLQTASATDLGVLIVEKAFARRSDLAAMEKAQAVLTADGGAVDVGLLAMARVAASRGDPRRAFTLATTIHDAALRFEALTAVVEAPVAPSSPGASREGSSLSSQMRCLFLERNVPSPSSGTGSDFSRAMYTCVTRDIEIKVLPEFMPERSDASLGHYFWAYTVEIANQGTHVVQVTDRHWRITDANGRVEEVKGRGIVGEQPVLQPGEMFRYTSGCPLSTPSGLMVGTYRVVEADGTIFDAEIPMFSLDSPFTKRVLN